MKYHPMVLAIGGSEYAMSVIKRSARRFEQLNDVNVQILTETDFQGDNLADPHFGKAYLWDKAPNNVDHILYYDCDMLPVRALDELPDVPFAAVTDVQTGVDNASVIWPKLKQHTYFNSGFMAVSRETQQIFDQVKMFQTNRRDQHGLVDQSIFNLVAYNHLKVHLLPKEYNYMLFLEPEIKTNVMMLHFAGLQKKMPTIATLLNLFERFEARNQALIAAIGALPNS